jgi:hypothetical protein
MSFTNRFQANYYKHWKNSWRSLASQNSKIKDYLYSKERKEPLEFFSKKLISTSNDLEVMEIIDDAFGVIDILHTAAREKGIKSTYEFNWHEDQINRRFVESSATISRDHSFLCAGNCTINDESYKVLTSEDFPSIKKLLSRINLKEDPSSIMYPLFLFNIASNKEGSLFLISRLKDFAFLTPLIDDLFWNVACLRLGVVDGLEQLLKGKFELKFFKKDIRYHINFTYDNQLIRNYFDRCIFEREWDLNKIKFMEGIILLNNPPSLISSPFKKLSYILSLQLLQDSIYWKHFKS